MKKLFFSAAMTIIFAAQCLAQGPSAEWDFKDYDKYSKAAVKIQTFGNNWSALGTGSVIYKTTEKHPTTDKVVKAYCVTAYHVVEDGIRFKIFFQSGLVYNGAKVVAYSKVDDVALLEIYVRESQPYLKVAKSVKEGDVARSVGYGGVSDINKPRYYESKVARVTPDSKKMFLYADSIPGDSGGPIMNAKGELIGVVSGGSAWLSNEKVKKFTWPTRCPATTSLDNIIKYYTPKELYKDSPETPLPLNAMN